MNGGLSGSKRKRIKAARILKTRPGTLTSFQLHSIGQSKLPSQKAMGVGEHRLHLLTGGAAKSHCNRPCIQGVGGICGHLL